MVPRAALLCIAAALIHDPCAVRGFWQTGGMALCVALIRGCRAQEEATDQAYEDSRKVALDGAFPSP